jgi:phage tail sheath protein FI
MPSAYTYPGVYVEEVPSGVRTIAGVSTSDTAFIDFFGRGPMNRAVRVTGMKTSPDASGVCTATAKRATRSTSSI